MSDSNNQPAKKKSKLSRSKKVGKKDSATCGRERVKSVFEITDLNESCDFKEPMTRKVSQCVDTVNINHGRSEDRPESVPKENEGSCDILETDEPVLCQVCSKDIGHMNSIRRQQHVNRCIDKIEEKDREEKNQSASLNKPTVPDCPMCKRTFKSVKMRQTHLKKCAVINNISTEEMLKLVKRQEDERVAAPSTSTDQVSTTSIAPKAATTKKRKIKEPKSHFDEDVQLAMAVSSSLADQNKSKADLLEENLKGLTEPSKKKRKKNMMEDVCLLTTLSEESKQRRVEERLQSVLLEEDSENSDDEISQVFQESTLSATKSNTDPKQLWHKSNQHGDTTDVKMFYVPTLMPPIVTNKLPTGSRLKRLSSIPGRETSFHVDKVDRFVKQPTDPGEEMFTASTQTAVILAELAADGTVVQADVRDHQQTLAELAADGTVVQADVRDNQLTPTADLSAHSSGFCEENLVMKETALADSRHQTVMAYKQMVNQPEFSDLTVTTSDTARLHGHKAVLFTRFPSLAKLLDQSKSSISLPLSREATLAFLTYVYTGELACTPYIQHELINLSDTFDLQPLKEACNTLSINVKTPGTGQEEDGMKTVREVVELHPVVNVKDIWGESDSEAEDLVEDGTDTECETDKPEAICDEDYYAIKCTQRRRHSHTEKLDSDKADSDETPSPDKSVQGNVELIEKLDEFSEGYDEMDVSMPLFDNGEDIATNVSDKEKTNNENDIDFKNSENNCNQPNGNNKPKENFNIYLQKERDCHSPLQNTIGEVRDQGPNEDRKADQSLPMDTSNIDLFQSPLSVTSSQPGCVNSPPTCSKSPLFNKSSQPGYVSNPPTCSKSPLFNKRKKQNITKITGVINLDFESDEDNDLDTNDSECDKNTDYKTLNTSGVSTNTDLDQEDSPNDVHEVAANLATNDANSPHGKNEKLPLSSQKCDKNPHNTHEYNSSNEDNDDELEITGDNLDEIKSKARNIQELTYLGQQISFHDSDTVPDKCSDISCSPDCLNTSQGNRGSKGSTSTRKNSQSNRNTTVIETDSASPNKTSNVDRTSVDPVDVADISGYTSAIDNDVDADVSGYKSAIYCDVEADIAKIRNSKTVPTDIERKEEMTTDTAGAGEDHTAEDNWSVEPQLNTSHSSFDGCQADVWDDFDDCGVVYADMPSPVISQRFPTDSNVSDNDDKCQTEQGDNVELNIDLCGDDPDCTIGEDDDSFVFDAGNNPSNDHNQSKFKTPTTTNNRARKQKEWMPPSPFTPMPAYDKMNTPNLKREVEKYGVKPVGKKRMVTVLKDIYHKTHQYETDSEFEDEDQLHKEQKAKEDDILSSQTAVDDDDDDVVLSQDTFMSSQESNISDLPEESILMSDGTSDSDAHSSPQKGVDIRKKLHGFFTSDKDLHMKVLLYEPLEIDVLKASLKEAGIKCSMDKLMEFLDEKCIAFTSKNTRKKAQSRRGKKKKTTKQ